MIYLNDSYFSFAACSFLVCARSCLCLYMYVLTTNSKKSLIFILTILFSFFPSTCSTSTKNNPQTAFTSYHIHCNLASTFNISFISNYTYSLTVQSSLKATLLLQCHSLQLTFHHRLVLEPLLIRQRQQDLYTVSYLHPSEAE